MLSAQSKSGKNLSLVSVVIATKNESANIASCIESIKKQTYPNIEIIVVDNSSADKTKEISKKYTPFVFDANINRTKTKNYRGSQLNYGVSRSNGIYIFFPDADMTFDSNLLEEAVNLTKKGVDALYIPETVLGKGIFGKIRNFERSFYNKTCIDAVRFIRKDIYLKVGGFDEKNISFGADDWDLMKQLKKMGAVIGITKNKIYHHEEKLNFITYIKKKSNYSNAVKEYVEKWGKNDKDVKKQLGFLYRYFGVFVENGKWRKLLSHPLLTLGMYFERFFVGLGWIFFKN